MSSSEEDNGGWGAQRLDDDDILERQRKEIVAPSSSSQSGLDSSGSSNSDVEIEEKDVSPTATSHQASRKKYRGLKQNWRVDIRGVLDHLFLVGSHHRHQAWRRDEFKRRGEDAIAARPAAIGERRSKFQEETKNDEEEPASAEPASAEPASAEPASAEPASTSNYTLYKQMQNERAKIQERKSRHKRKRKETTKDKASTGNSGSRSMDESDEDDSFTFADSSIDIDSSSSSLSSSDEEKKEVLEMDVSSSHDEKKRVLEMHVEDIMVYGIRGFENHTAPWPYLEPKRKKMHFTRQDQQWEEMYGDSIDITEFYNQKLASCPPRKKVAEKKYSAPAGLRNYQIIQNIPKREKALATDLGADAARRLVLRCWERAVHAACKTIIVNDDTPADSSDQSSDTAIKQYPDADNRDQADNPGGDSAAPSGQGCGTIVKQSPHDDSRDHKENPNLLLVGDSAGPSGQGCDAIIKQSSDNYSSEQKMSTSTLIDDNPTGPPGSETIIKQLSDDDSSDQTDQSNTLIDGNAIESSRMKQAPGDRSEQASESSMLAHRNATSASDQGGEMKIKQPPDDDSSEQTDKTGSLTEVFPSNRTADKAIKHLHDDENDLAENASILEARNADVASGRDYSRDRSEQKCKSFDICIKDNDESSDAPFSLECPNCGIAVFEGYEKLKDHYYGDTEGRQRGCCWSLLQEKQLECIRQVLETEVQLQSEALARQILLGTLSKAPTQPFFSPPRASLHWDHVLGILQETMNVAQPIYQVSTTAAATVLDSIQVEPGRPPLLLNEQVMQVVSNRIIERYARVPR